MCTCSCTRPRSSASLMTNSAMVVLRRFRASAAGKLLNELLLLKVNSLDSKK